MSNEIIYMGLDSTKRLVQNVKGYIGDLTNLETTEKGDLVAAINEVAKSGGSTIYTSEEEPTDAKEGDLWFTESSDTGSSESVPSAEEVGF